MALKSKTKKKTNESTKQEFVNSLKKNDDAEEQGLCKTVNNVSNSQETIIVICCSKDIFKTQNKKARGYIGKQGELLNKVKNTKNVFDDVNQSRSTVYFEISHYNFLKKYPLFETSTLQLSCFKNDFKAIKVVCKENPTFFV